MLTGRKSRVKQLVIYGSGLIFVLIVGGIMGMQTERKRQEAMDARQEHTSTIAVVNMDEGVIINGEQINYASQLMSFPGEHFVVTGLSEAKAGIENDSYAAYIVIPETFSAAVTSIENEPKKVTLGYQYNAKLDEEAMIQAVTDVNSFSALLNSNIAYMYMDAILDSFHRVQDDSVIILANDASELVQLEAIDATHLIAAADPVEETEVAFNIQPVNLTVFQTQNDSLLSSMHSDYINASEEGRREYAAIQETSGEVTTASDNLLATYSSIVNDTAEEQSRILAEGQENLEITIGLYNYDMEEIRATVEESILTMLQIQTEEANEQLADILVNFQNKLTESLYQQFINKEQENMNKEQVNIENIVKKVYTEGYTEGYTDALSTLNNYIEEDGEEISAENIQDEISGYSTGEESISGIESNNYDTYIEEVEECIKRILVMPDASELTFPDLNENTDRISLSTENDAVNTAVTDTTNAIMDRFELKYDTESITTVLQTYFADALLDENQRQMNRLSATVQATGQDMYDYGQSLVEYDPLKYIENANLSIYLDEIEKNTGEMTSAVEMNNNEYMLYAGEVYSESSEDKLQLRNSLDEANAKTIENVVGCVDALALSRAETNRQNSDMLEGFTESLRYTRVGSQGNAEVYDCLINPVISQEVGQAAEKENAEETILKEENALKTLLIIIFGIGIAVCSVWALVGLRQRAGMSGEHF